MSRNPAVFTSHHRIRFADLDPYKHMRTAMYSAYFVDHRMDALREQAGWDLRTLERLPFMTFVKRIEIAFLRPVAGDDAIVISSFVREFIGSEAHIECTMADKDGVGRGDLPDDRGLRRQSDAPCGGLAGGRGALFFER
jgi:acyl-CoA thioester hydrolase